MTPTYHRIVAVLSVVRHVGLYFKQWFKTEPVIGEVVWAPNRRRDPGRMVRSWLAALFLAVVVSGFWFYWDRDQYWSELTSVAAKEINRTCYVDGLRFVDCKICLSREWIVVGAPTAKFSFETTRHQDGQNRIWDYFLRRGDLGWVKEESGMCIAINGEYAHPCTP